MVSIMHRLRRTALVAGVWLTAAMTVVADVPYSVCRCPEGWVKLFCRGPAVQAGCCCDGKCCASPPGNGSAADPQAVEATCCCRRTAGLGQDLSSARGSSLQSNCCTQTLIRTEILASAPEKSSADEDLIAASPLAAEAAGPCLPVVSKRPSWQVYRLPPPTDLVTVLQRLLL
jgi:hypothetical protein